MATSRPPAAQVRVGDYTPMWIASGLPKSFPEPRLKYYGLDRGGRASVHVRPWAFPGRKTSPAGSAVVAEVRGPNRLVLLYKHGARSRVCQADGRQLRQHRLAAPLTAGSLCGGG